MTTYVTHCCRRSAQVLVVSSAHCIGWRLPQIGGSQSVVFNNYGPLISCKLNAPRITWINRSRGLQNSYRSVLKLQQRRQCVLYLNSVKRRLLLRLDSSDIAKHPKQQINRVNRLINQRASTIEGLCSSPARISVVFRWTKPLHPRICKNRFPQNACLHPILHSN